MTAKDFLEIDQITCPHCHNRTDANTWKSVSPYCETCGDHVGFECPICNTWYDMTWDDDNLREASREKA